jgi:hypothetical protein
MPEGDSSPHRQQALHDHAHSELWNGRHVVRPKSSVRNSATIRMPGIVIIAIGSRPAPLVVMKGLTTAPAARPLRRLGSRRKIDSARTSHSIKSGIGTYAPYSRIPQSRPKPKTKTHSAAASSRPRTASSPFVVFALAMREARLLARTARLARAPVVIAVPSDIASVAPMPAQKIPCDKAKTRTRRAPAQGLVPAASNVIKAVFQEKPAARLAGSGAWKWPQWAS